MDSQLTELCRSIRDMAAEHMRLLGRLTDLAERIADNRPAAEITRHSSDFRSVVWFGRSYAFTAQQAAVVLRLWQAWENGTPEVGKETILEALDAEVARVDQLFRDHPAWETMIVAGSTRGSLKLQKPQ